MPITKRHLYDAYLYGPGDLYEESPQEHILEDIGMSQTLGAFHQIRYLAMFSVEVIYILYFLFVVIFVYFYCFCLFFLFLFIYFHSIYYFHFLPFYSFNSLLNSPTSFFIPLNSSPLPLTPISLNFLDI